ncbi:hypothetical protein FJU08_21715 [Martelella alba]|uniref:Tyrosine specific protein phosphatases domain-containing protein n=1 Tax=Martelella alba TaxID=2590451 RepID=A0A506U1C9_9HYPH|nr:hypothetical protein [Martelella alba]TPW26735.1 hypothetical protein FJU08_21715 [Martelella alba]
MESETSIRTCLALPMGGKVVTLGFPGFAFDAQGEAFICPERLAATLDHDALESCTLLIILVEEEEVPEDAFDLLGAACAKRNMKLVHLPIRDYQSPDTGFTDAWRQHDGLRRAMFARSETLALSCHYGAGRSGMMAARLLIDQGVAPEDAITRVREQFPDSIESDAQLQWLLQGAQSDE